MRIEFKCPGCGAVIESDGRSGGSEAACPGCGAGLVVPLAAVGPGVTIGGFRIERLIGKGGMGEVYLARQLSLDRDVALKILPARFASQREDVERFLREMRFLARLDHPNIVTAYEAGEDEGVLFLAMAYVNGESLAARLRGEHRLAMPEALRLVRPLAEALAYAWGEHRLLHRDVKPGNILLDPHGDPKLLDFGLAKGLGADSQLTMGNMMMGSPNYMSPEQAEGHPDLDFRSDIYGLGATLYHMLTGKAPFDASSVMETLRKSVSEKLPDPRETNSTVTGGCVALLSRMLALAPDQRHPNWAVLIEDLVRVSKGLLPHLTVLPDSATALSRGSHAAGAPTARPDTAAPPAAPPAPRHRGLSAGAWAAMGVAAFASLALLTLWLGVHMSGRDRTPPQPPEVARLAPKRPTPVAPVAGKTPAAAVQGALAARTVQPSAPPAVPPPSEPPPEARPEPPPAVSAPPAAVRPAAPTPAAGTPSAAQAGEALARHAGALADALLGRDRSLLRAALAAGAADPALAAMREPWRALAACAEEADAVSETLGASFRSDMGKEVPVELATGTRSLLIADVKGDTVIARQVLRVGGQVKGEVARDFRLADLTPRARLVRLGSGDDAVTQLRRGLFAMECRAADAARRCFEQSACMLGTSLVSRLDARLRARADAKDEQARAAAELAAARDFEQLIRLACHEHTGGIAAAAVAASVQSVRRTRYPESKAAEIGKATSDFRARHGATECARGQAAALETLSLVRPDMPLEVDAATLDAAMARWKADNKEMPTEPTAAILPDGIMITWLTDDNNAVGAKTAVRSLAALAGLPVTELDVRLWADADLRPLKDMPLKRIRLGTTRCDNSAASFDLAPLAGAPLTELCSPTGSAIPVKSLAPLRGMPLRHLAVTGVEDLSPLAGMPLADLTLSRFAGSGLLALRKLQLERLTLTYSSSQLPHLGKGTFDFVNLYFLSHLRDLTAFAEREIIELHVIGCGDFTRLAGLRGAKIEKLAINSCGMLRDLSALRGMAIKDLGLGDCKQISDITPLRGMPLRSLSLASTAVSDLTPLAGMPLRSLSLSNTAVSNLTPLAEMPLTYLDVRGAPVKDFSPVEKIPSLNIVR